MSLFNENYLEFEHVKASPQSSSRSRGRSSGKRPRSRPAGSEAREIEEEQMRDGRARDN